MKNITENACKSLLNGKNCKLGGICTNTYSDFGGYGYQNTEIDNGGLYLFGNCIAKLENNNLYVRIHTNSNTTRERLNGFKYFGYNISVTSKKGIAHINGEPVQDYYAWHKIEKI